MEDICIASHIVIATIQAAENVNSDCRSLFKPWPQENPQPVKTVAPSVKEAPDSVTEEKLQEIQLADDMIMKAQKLRENKETKIQPKTLASSTRNISTTKTPAVRQNVLNAVNVRAKQAPSSALRSTKQAHSSATQNTLAKARPSGPTSKINVHHEKPASTLNLRKPVNYVAAHVKAPFKTNTTNVKTMKSADRNATTKTRLPSAMAPPAARLLNRPTSSRCQIASAGEKQKRATADQVQTNVSCSATQSEARLHYTETPTHVVDSRYHRSEPSNIADNEKRSESCEDKQSFILAMHGKTLAVSKKLRKLRAQNAKLKKQLYDASLTTPVTRHGSQAQQFMHKYSKYVELKPSTKLHPQKLFHGFSKLTEICEEKLQLAANKELSFEDILRVRSTLGFVIDSFDSLQSEYARLAVPTIALPKPPTLKHNQLVWLPHHIGQVNVRVPSMLQYSSLKQLKHYIELVQKVQYLQVQLHLMDYVHSDLLCDYTLDNTTNPSSLTPNTYRALYALLCTDGQTFPALIQDQYEDG